MFNLANNSKLRGIGYRVLNVLRPCNIISLLAVTAASWVMVVMTAIRGQFFFFDAIAHVFISSVAMFLVLTEVQFGFLSRYFAHSWPVFSNRDGFLWLGLAMIVLGCDMLANLNKPAFTVANLGLPLWRLILAAGILSITFGTANLIATVVFRDGPARLTARMIRADGNLADGGMLGTAISSSDMRDYYSTRSNSLKRINTTRSTKEDESLYPPTDSGGGFGGAAANRFKRMTQVFTRKNPLAAASSDSKKMQISAPIPVGADAYDNARGDSYSHTADVDVEHAAASSAASNTDYGSYREDRASPILPAVRRPPTAMHPAMNGHYSVADMSQF
ncbi:hypothetical protein CMQ_4588 [Grosmannia clavigera kw1407]|uniref:DUF7598 domain-containing protein n=1 Tax=Grosmannia clavigera (strain kw1407 / UAMH 11150) TaxID=655863 RepID=F0XTQ4_GROCL|nr:uncharacterized protein CMQ_4588 [Grosmannia clavigera kw1407]EFW98736.1 hypothetical protein CMQ_4588 [Grosmannia clavigera kw1407]